MIEQSASKKAFLDLVKMLASQKFENNELPGEVELCDAIGVSRTSIRAALSLLAAKNIILKRAKKKTIILPINQWNWFDEDVLNIVKEILDIKELLNYICELRLSLEPQIAALCATNSNIRDLVILEDATNMMRDSIAKKDRELWQKGDLLFHNTIIEATHNPFFINLKKFLSDCLLTSINYTTDEDLEMSKVSDEEHRVLLEAIRRKSAKDAHDCMRDIIQKTTVKIFKDNIPSLYYSL